MAPCRTTPRLTTYFDELAAATAGGRGPFPGTSHAGIPVSFILSGIIWGTVGSRDIREGRDLADAYRAEIASA